MRCPTCGRDVPSANNFCPSCGTPVGHYCYQGPGKKKRTASRVSVNSAIKESLEKMTPKERRKARRLVRQAKKKDYDASANVVTKDGRVKTWRELGFNIDEPPETEGTFASPAQFDKWCNRGSKARGLEREGKIDQAVTLYKKNVAENCETPGDYERLAIIYSKRRDLPKAIEYCDKALSSPACTNPAQDTARRDFQERKKKLEARLKDKKEKEKQ